jgi:hypothetical protein
MSIFVIESKRGGEDYTQRLVTLGLENASDEADLQSYGESMNAAPGSSALNVANGDAFMLTTGAWVKL